MEKNLKKNTFMHIYTSICLPEKHNTVNQLCQSKHPGSQCSTVCGSAQHSEMYHVLARDFPPLKSAFYLDGRKICRYFTEQTTCLLLPLERNPDWFVSPHQCQGPGTGHPPQDQHTADFRMEEAEDICMDNFPALVTLVKVITRTSEVASSVKL